MAVYVVTAVTALFYATQLQIKLAFTLIVEEERSLMIGVGLFSARPFINKRIMLPPIGERPQFKLPGGVTVGLWPALNHLRRHAGIDGWRASVLIGTGDAANTALICGAVRAALSALKVRARVEPDFSKRVLKLSGGWIVRVTTGHIIYAAMMAAREIIVRRISRGNGQASD